MPVIHFSYGGNASWLEKARRLLSESFGFLLVVLAPVMILLLATPSSFISGWNEGRSGLLFAAFFVLLEWYDGRTELQLKLNRRITVRWTLAAILLALYYTGVFLLGLNNSIAEAGIWLGLPKMPSMFSWVSMWEHVAFALYLLAVYLSAYGLSKLAKMITPIAYLLGMATIFLLDAIFPYASLGPMQAIVHVIVPIVTSLLSLSGIGAIWQPELSRLFIFVTREGVQWFKGALDFYWPCVGVHSMIIFFMIITVLVSKIDAPRYRKALYSAVGALGTFSINVTRIYLVSYYVASEGISKAKAFHESAGEIMFMVWAVAFLLIVVKTEDLIYARTISKHSDEVLSKAGGASLRVGTCGDAYREQ